MSEHYYLLRNNRESGPFALDELLQQCLLPGDLLWVEGRSQNWTEAFELPEVQDALPKGYSYSPTETVALEHISDREQSLRAEALRRRALAALYQQQPPIHIGTARPDMGSGRPLVDPDDLEVVHHKPERPRGALPEFLLFCTLSALVVLGWRGGVFAHLIQVRTPAVEVAAQSLTNEDAHAARALTLLPQPAAVSYAMATTAPDSTQHADSALAVNAAPIVHYAPRARVAAPVTPLPESTVVAGTAPIEVKTAAITNNVAPATEPRRETPAAAPREKEKEDKPAVTKTETAPAAATVEEAPKEEKRRGFLRGLFKKKKRDEPASDGQ
ncbi:MAG: hypothetical protein EOO08_14010 [Chitinophagaceae bacterium]|nr:MAG: hypothetical protein EOO08_14010 [Chitinophagaceae bacterium]